MKDITKFSWPIVVVVTLFLFREQIGSQFDRLSGVSIGSFNLVLEQTAKGKNNEAAYDIIKGLNNEGVIALLSTGKSIIILNYESDNSVKLVNDFAGYLELERNGLIKTNLRLETIDTNNIENYLLNQNITDIRIELNDKGKLAWDIIAESISRALNT